MSEPEIDRRLTEIRDDLRELRKLLSGGNGEDGALTRLTKLEQGQSFIRTCYLLLVAGLMALMWMVLPGYFQHNK